MRTPLLLAAAAAIIGIVPLTALAADAVKITQDEKTLQVEIDGKPFTTYHFADDLVRPFVRPFFWPVRAADGTEVTSDQLQAPKQKNGKSADHPHHRSIWVSHGSVNGIDHWSFQQKPEPPKQRHIKFDKMDADGFVEQLVWDDLNGQPLLAETRTVRFIPYADDSRGIDLTVALTAAHGDVTLGDTKEAGLAAVRVATQIAEHPVLTNSTGARATNDKQEAAIWGKPAEWVDESGTIDGKPHGIAILADPNNPRHPTTWHARTYGLIAPNEWGLHDFDKKANPPHAGDMKIPQGQTATFHYRIVIHAGDETQAKIAEKYRDFAAGK
jgi:hypothetical protein